MKLINLAYALGSAVSGLTREIDGELWIRVTEVRGSLRSAPIIESETLIKAHEDIGYERGLRDGYAEALTEVEKGKKMRLIDVDDFITKTRELYNQAGWGFRDVHYSQSDIEFNLSMMPTIDPVRHGRWIDLPGGNVYCTECGEQFDYRANYCPECGSKMDGGEEYGKND